MNEKHPHRVFEPKLCVCDGFEKPLTLPHHTISRNHVQAGCTSTLTDLHRSCYPDPTQYLQCPRANSIDNITISPHGNIVLKEHARFGKGTLAHGHLQIKALQQVGLFSHTPSMFKLLLPNQISRGLKSNTLE